MKEQEETSGNNEIEVSCLPDKEFKVMVIKMLIKLGRRMDEPIENTNKEMENTRKYKIEATELKNRITDLKTTIEGLNHRLDEAKKESVCWNTRQWNSLKQCNKKKKAF